MAAALAGVSVAPPRIPVVQNVDGEPETEPAAIVAKLVRQVVEPVRWEACARRLIAMDAERVIEVGPGATLTGLYRRISRRFPVIALDRPGAWEAL
jgi:[acyl-carrier-protein] S-malonyltransferase